jgi:peptidoglycan hydrolase-like protein with peptidoglycan-binding domain
MPEYDDYTYNEVHDCRIETDTVKYGDTGSMVKTVQRIAKSYFENDLNIDGECGTETVKAIIALQKALNLSPDGVCGNDTWNGIINDL